MSYADDSELYGELTDLFDQAIFMGRNGEGDRRYFAIQPNTDHGRMMSTSPQARWFANAVVDVLVARERKLFDDEHKPEH